MYKVLIVDDEPMILEGLKHIIDWESFDLEIAAEANYALPALEIIEHNKIDLLITDIKMPFMDGLELIKQIRNKNFNIRIVVLSGFNDFEYVRSALKFGIENYLLKPISEKELISTLENIIIKLEKDFYEQTYLRDDINIIKNNILYRWLTNSIDRLEFVQRAKLLNIDLNCKKLYVVTSKVSENKTGSEFKIQNKSLLSLHIQNVLAESIGTKYNFIAFPDLEHDIVLIFFGTLEYDDRVLYSEVFPKCIANVKNKLGVDIFLTIGNIQESHECAYMSYHYAKSLQTYRLVYPDTNIITHKNAANTNSREKLGLQEKFNTLNTLIAMKNRQAAVDFIKDFFRFIKSFKHLTPSMIQGISIELLLSIINTTQYIKNNTEAFEEFTAEYTDVLKKETIGQLEEWMIFVVNKSVDLLTIEDRNNDSTIKKVLFYIQQNYPNDINLKTVSSEFSINTAYLGQLFNKEIGESFSNYLNRIRVERAKELLANSGLKTAEISVKVGYSNTNYFYTIFKKLIGVSPTEFKDRTTGGMD